MKNNVRDLTGHVALDAMEEKLKREKGGGHALCNQARFYGIFLGQNPMGPSWDRHLPIFSVFSSSLEVPI